MVLMGLDDIWRRYPHWRAIARLPRLPCQLPSGPFSARTLPCIRMAAIRTRDAPYLRLLSRRLPRIRDSRFRIVMVSHPFIYYNTTQAESENGFETGAVKINLANECIFGREFIEYVYGFKLPGTELCSFYRATPSRINARKLCAAGDW